MAHRLLVAAATLAALHCAAQSVLPDGGFEDRQDGLPVGWEGTGTGLAHAG